MNFFFSSFFTQYALNRIKSRFSKKKHHSLDDSALAFRSCFQLERDKKEPATHRRH